MQQYSFRWNQHGTLRPARYMTSCEKILDLDINVRICFMSSGEINREASGEIYPAVSLGCFVRKPVTIDYLIKRIMAELD